MTKRVHVVLGAGHTGPLLAEGVRRRRIVDGSGSVAFHPACSYVQGCHERSAATLARADRPGHGEQDLAIIENRIRELDRHGPPNAPGYACAVCKDAELHRLAAILKERVR
jgi:hypothetical protein